MTKQQQYFVDMRRRQQVYTAYIIQRMKAAGAGKDVANDFFVKFVAEEANSTLKITKNEPVSDLPLQALNLEYSTSNEFGTWKPYNVDDVLTLANEGDFVCFRASNAGNTKFARVGKRSGTVTAQNFYYFQMNGKIAAYGNIMSLLNKKQVLTVMQEDIEIGSPSQLYGTFTFFGLFYQCTALTRAPSLPATVLASHCYDCMFRGCTSLREMPDLPAKELTPGCYMHMFNGCNSINATKKIYATKADEGACYGMFWQCENLEEANILDDCIFEYAYTNAFRYMFVNCEKLRKGTNLIVNGKVGHAACNTTFGTYGSTVTEIALSAVPNIHIEELQNRSGLYGALFRGCKLLKSVPPDYLKNSASLISSFLSTYNQTDPGVASADISTSINIKDMYGSMFQNCESLSAAPFLYECALSTATYAAVNQYNSIFMGCTQLSSLSTDFTKYDANLNNILKNAAPTGTLYCKNSDAAADLNQHRSQLGLQDGWSIEPLPDNFEIP